MHIVVGVEDVDGLRPGIELGATEARLAGIGRGYLVDPTTTFSASSRRSPGRDVAMGARRA
jgi:hypothetical protein